MWNSGTMLQLMRLARRRCGGAQTQLLFTQATAAEAEEKTLKYEHVRKLIVGLGNPGDKFKRTRYAASHCYMERELTTSTR